MALAASCGGETPVQPTPTPTVTSISPSSGPSIGGTPITVAGSNFATGASLTMGGVAALNVTVIDSTLITATTPPHASGTTDIVVSTGGRSAMLPGAYTFMKVENTPPVISSVNAQGTRPREPSNFADLNEEIDIVAAISSDDTPLDQLTYGWSADAGTFIGTGPAVKWRAPSSLAKTPVSYPLTLTVTEQYKTTDENGAVVTRENKVSGKVTVRVHDSKKEVSDLASEFLIDFSNSAVSADTVVRNFSTDRACGKTQERDDIQDNRAKYIINSYSLGFPPAVTVNFGGVYASFEARAPKRADACVKLSCGWKSTIKATGTVESVSGTCRLTELYDESDRWKLCWSEFRGTSTLTGKPVNGLSFRP